MPLPSTCSQRLTLMNPETPLEGGGSAGQGPAIAGGPNAISRRARLLAVLRAAVRRARLASRWAASVIAGVAALLWAWARRAVRAGAPRAGRRVAATAALLRGWVVRAVQAGAPRVGSRIATAAALLRAWARRAVRAGAPRAGRRVAAAAALLRGWVVRAVQAGAPRVGSWIAADAALVRRGIRHDVRELPALPARLPEAAALAGRGIRRALRALPPPTAWPAAALRYVRTRARLVAEEALLVLAAISVLAVLGMACNWWRYDVVLSGSMAPAMPPGAVVLAQSEPDTQVTVGQVLAFHPPSDPNILVTHRVIKVIHVGGKVEIRTQGDANNAPDQWTAVLQGGTAWHVTYVVPGLGYLAIWATVAWVRIVALLTMIGILAGVALARIWREEPR